MSSSVRLAVKAGACMRNGGDGRICALQSNDCPSDATFATPRELDQSGGGLAHGGACTTRSGTEETSKIGWCANEGCTSDASACRDPSNFVPVDNRCTIRVDSSRGDEETLFGRCGTDSTCYWSSADCQADPSSWIPAYQVSANSKCTCDSVRVGACFDDGFYYCAITANACDKRSEWIDAVTLQGQADAPDCFLCRGQSGTPLGSNTNVQDPSPLSAPTLAPIVTTPSVSVMPARNQGRNQESVVLGATLGGVCSLVFLCGAFVFFRYRHHSGKHDMGMKDLTDPPSESPTITQVNVGYHEDDCVSDIEG